MLEDSLRRQATELKTRADRAVRWTRSQPQSISTTLTIIFLLWLDRCSANCMVWWHQRDKEGGINASHEYNSPWIWQYSWLCCQIGRFDPLAWGNGFTEGNSWHHSFPPWALDILVELHGGKGTAALLRDSSWYLHHIYTPCTNGCICTFFKRKFVE